jgi:lipase
MKSRAMRHADDQPLGRLVPTTDGQLSAFEWPGDEPTIFFAHAGGFHARCWDEVIRLLPSFRCIALDVLGHGSSAAPPPPEPYRWDRLAQGAAAVVEALGIHNALGVGHSMGGYLLTRAAAARPGTFARLLLVDPSIIPAESYGRVVPSGSASFVLRRRNSWSSVEEMIERFTGRPPFGHWKPDVLADYCRYGLRHNEDGTFRLACSPEVEAAIYSATADSSPYPDISRVRIPVRVLRARQRPADATMNMSYSPTAPDLARRFPMGEDVLFPDHSHYIPMEDPGLIAAQVRMLAGRQGEP